MARKKRSDVDADASKVTRVQKRKPRVGPKRAMNLVMLDTLCTRLEALAVMRKTNPAEIVQDLIESATVGLRLSMPGLRVLGEEGHAGGETGENPAVSGDEAAEPAA